MKFRVAPKDLIIFGIFCVFLLIMSSLAVLNVTSLLDSTEFYGLNFLAGFLPPYLVPTLVVFGVVLAAIFMSVSSYIFERDTNSTGIGLTFKEKEEKGYSRWLKPNEMKKAPGIVRVPIKAETANGAGIVVINDGRDMYVDNEHHHTLVVGQTGSGKTTALVDPLIYSLSKKGESMIMTDPKGEIYKNHSEMLRAKGYKIVVLNFRDPAYGNAWNPLTLPYQLYKSGNFDKAIELLEDVSLNIIYDPENKNDPFWEKSSADYFSGLVLGLFDDAKEEQININSVNYMSTVGEDTFATSNYIKEYFTLKGEESTPYTFANNTINAPSDTKGSILSVFRSKIRQFATRENLSEMLSYSDFKMSDIGNEKTAVFMIVHDEKTTYHALATIFIKQVYETLIGVAQKEPNGRLKFRTNFILDEFANMPPLKDVTTMVTAARSRNIRFNFIIQNYAQLSQVYGKENGDTIKGNCGNIIYLISSELAALEEISKMCGEVKSKEKEKTSSMPLVTVSDLQRLPQWTMIVLRLRMMPFKTKMTPNWKMENENMWGVSFPKAEYPIREKHEIKLFDIKSYVQKAKEESKMMGDNPFMSEQSPFMPNSPFVPSMFNPKPKDNSFDVDDLVKRIDAKIAELEAEEEAEKKAKEKESKTVDVSDDIEDVSDIKDELDTYDDEIDEFDISDNNVTDDQFFDDFFNDD